jgi:hypothetical protein
MVKRIRLPTATHSDRMACTAVQYTFHGENIMATLPAQLGSRATPYVARFFGNRFMGNNFREAVTDAAQSAAEPFVVEQINHGIDHVNTQTGANVPHYRGTPTTTVPSLFGGLFGGYLANNRPYVFARATQNFHGPENTHEGINDFVRRTDDAVHFDRFWENNGS